MKFELSAAPGLNTFTGYGEGYVLVNGQRFAESVIVLAGRIEPWSVPGVDALTEAHLAQLADLGAEVVLLGTGATLRFPHPRLLQGLVRAGIGVEVMDTQAACRTFNILVAEERKVAAALLFS